MAIQSPLLDLRGLTTLSADIKNFVNNHVTGAGSTITKDNLDINRALISNAQGKVAVSNVTSTELGYLSGVTSNLQSQISTINTNISNITNNFSGGVLKVSQGGTGQTSLANVTVGNATTATKLGSSTIGSITKPIYLNNGTATASNANVGNNATPIYMSNGNLTALSGNIGAYQKPVYISNGEIKPGISITYGTSLPAVGNNGDIFILIS